MSEREQPKPDQLRADSEASAKVKTPEEPKIDTQYARKAREYFNNLQEDAKADPEFVEFLAQANKEVSLLSQDRNIEKTQAQPKEVSIALGELAGNMHVNNVVFEERLTGDLKQDAESEKRYLETKKLFMETGAKVFLNADSDISKLVTVLGKFKDLDLVGVFVGFTAAEIQKAARENPREAAKQLDEIIDQAGSVMKTAAWEAYKVEDPAMAEKNKKQIAIVAEAVYNLQLMRDGLQKKIYGREDLSPSEARKIDTTRQEIKGENKPELTKEEASVVKKVEQLLSEEQADEQRAETKGANFPRSLKPALDAFRDVYKDETAVFQRINSLAKQTADTTKQRLASGLDKGDRLLARNNALDATIAQLTSAERKALQGGADKEFQRQKATNHGFPFQRSGERMLRELLDNLAG